MIRSAIAVVVLLSSAQMLPAQPVTEPHPKLEFHKWSGEINVPDPVALSLDNRGRVYLTQTTRRKAADLDIRNNRDWITNDVGFQTVEDKLRFYRERLHTDESNPKKHARRVQDLNRDGIHDYRDLTVLSELIHQMEDQDGDGTADSIRLFADGFQTEVTGIAAGVLWFNGDVYTTIAPDVWKLRDLDDDGRADTRQKLVTGFGLHIAYAGHDMHGPTVGPDGKIYWSIGDKGISVERPGRREFRYPNEGGVLRCNPDGSEFEVFAHGLRNIQELAFDEYGNLFGVDNDSDRPGEKERFVYIVPESDAGWRCNYQYRGDGYNPWMAEQLWVPKFDGQAAYIIPPIQNYIDGPAGFTYNPGTALSPEYKGYFFLTGAPKGLQMAFRVEPDGASFRMVDSHTIGQGLPLVGINFGPDGALYAVDWGGGYPLNQKGAIWSIDVAGAAASPERREVATLLRTGARETDTAQLSEQLGHPDQRIRMQAQFELVRRRDVDTLVAASAPSSPKFARFHAIWGLAQLSRSDREMTKACHTAIQVALSDSDPEIISHGLRVARDMPSFPGEVLPPLLTHSNDIVRFHAAMALGRHTTADSLAAIITFIESSDPDRPYLRHAASVALNRLPRLSELSRHETEAVRLTTALTLRRLMDPSIAAFLADDSRAVVEATARAIHDNQSMPAAMPALCRLLPDTDHTSEVIVRRAINACLRSGQSESGIRLAEYAGRTDVPDSLRILALKSLAMWNAPPDLDNVDGWNRVNENSRREAETLKLDQVVTRLLTDRDQDIVASTFAMMRALKIKANARDLAHLVSSSEASSTLRLEALNLLAAQNNDQLVSAIQSSLESDSAPLRSRGLELLARIDTAKALERTDRVLTRSASVLEQQTAASVLGQLKTRAGDMRLLKELKRLTPDSQPRPFELEILDAAAKRAEGHQELAEQLQQIKQDKDAVLKEKPVAAFRECLTGGNAQRGRSLFETHITAACIRCHRIGKKGSQVGPDLSEIASKRKKHELLRSIVAPSAEIEPKYVTTLVALDSGKVLPGLVTRRTKKSITLFGPQQKEVEIPLDEIDELVESKQSIMPELIKNLSRHEIRDILAYLETLEKKPGDSP